MFLFKLILAFTLIPLIELYLLLRLSEVTSIQTTIWVVIGTGIFGSWMARRQATMAWSRFRRSVGVEGGLEEARFPGQEIQDGVMIAFAAALLLTPGILTDALGFTMLFPLGRTLLRKHVFPRLFPRFQFEFHGPGAPPSGFEKRPDGEASYSEPMLDSGTIDAPSYQNKEPS